MSNSQKTGLAQLQYWQYYKRCRQHGARLSTKACAYREGNNCEDINSGRRGSDHVAARKCSDSFFAMERFSLTNQKRHLYQCRCIGDSSIRTTTAVEKQKLLLFAARLRRLSNNKRYLAAYANWKQWWAGSGTVKPVDRFDSYTTLQWKLPATACVYGSRRCRQKLYWKFGPLYDTAQTWCIDFDPEISDVYVQVWYIIF